MTHDELVAMTDDEREQWLQEQVEELIQTAQPRNVLKLRKLQAQLDGIRRRYKDPIARCNAIHAEMIRSLNELNAVLRGSVR